MGQKAPSRETVILVVDGDPALRSSLEFILNIEGYAVRAYANGRALLDDTDLPACGCLVIDHRLTDIDGLKVVSALRARSVQLPAILIATNPNRALQLRALEANVTIVEKPLITGTLFQRIDAVLR